MPEQCAQSPDKAKLQRIRTLSFGLLKEDLDDVEMLRSREWITANANAKRLAESNPGCLSNGLVRERTRARNNTLKWNS